MPKPNLNSCNKNGARAKVKKKKFNQTLPGNEPGSTGREILYMLQKKHEFVVVTNPIQNGGQIGAKFKTGGLYVTSSYFLD